MCVYEAFYNVISEAHTAIAYGGLYKIYFEINFQYSWIPRYYVEIVLKQCIPCQTRKPIISLGMMTRVQIVIIDIRTRADKVLPDIVYCWILNCIDHFSKFSWAFTMNNKSAASVVYKIA